MQSCDRQSPALRRAAIVALLLLIPAEAAPQPPIPLVQPAAPPAPPLPPLSAPQAEPLPPVTAPPAAAPVQASGRVFCAQDVSFRLADPESVAAPFRDFLGIWSDAAWDVRTCAALIVEDVQPDGTATITYVYGPSGSTSRVAGGILHGTGVIRDGELLFQNSDGTQYAFRPLLADLEGHMTTPKGATFAAVFKRTP